MIALVAAALICPTPLPPGPIEVTNIVHNTSLIVSRVDANAGDILGTNPENHRPVSVRVCTGANINGRSSVEAIQPRDNVLTRELRDPSGEFVAVDVQVNLYAFYARVLSAAPHQIELRPLTEQLQPATYWPAYLGLSPTSAAFNASTRVTKDEGGVSKSVPPASLASVRPGAIVKVYGYKPPSSAVVDAFLIEILEARDVGSRDVVCC